MSYTTKDSGKRSQFDSGAVRDTNEGKPRYDLIDVYSLDRLAHLMTRGAVKYGDRNWEKGIPTERFIESADRHWHAFKRWHRDRVSGRTDEPMDEDHLAATLFNIMGIMHNQEVSDE